MGPMPAGNMMRGALKRHYTPCLPPTEMYLRPLIAIPAGGGFHARGGQNSHGGYNAPR